MGSAPGAPAFGSAGVVSYLGLAFGLAWPVWLGGLAATRARGDGLLGAGAQGVVLVGSFAPAVAAAVVRRWVTGEGFQDAGLRPNLRRGWRGYAWAVIGPAAALAATSVLAAVTGLSRPDPSGLRARKALPAAGAAAPGGFAQFLPLAVGSALPSAALLWGEEFGWRGYLQPRLVGGRGVAAAVATGLIWGVWHWPLALAGYGTFGQAPRWFGLVLYPLVCIPLSGFFGRIQGAAGSVWAPSLAHAVHNNVFGGGLLMLFAGGPNFSRVVLLLVPAYGALWAWLGRTAADAAPASIT